MPLSVCIDGHLFDNVFRLCDICCCCCSTGIDRECRICCDCCCPPLPLIMLLLLLLPSPNFCSIIPEPPPNAPWFNCSTNSLVLRLRSAASGPGETVPGDRFGVWSCHTRFTCMSKIDWSSIVSSIGNLSRIASLSSEWKMAALSATVFIGSLPL